ncbi:hypothetical protein FGG08_003923 [Glutinoglossum americanum]|uniref:Arsenite methyltransferase n=1 Tax=Glutinoglossum americanum TaxID=1670608 RepID=A0A9P8I1J7_9PEZI|nr:hypothetical protein FGG08_003923 [Glutinoglossum americanum]
MDANETYQLVKDHYGAYAKRYDTELSLEHSQKVAQAFGYTLDELASIPDGANLGASCGNPLATAKLEKGEVAIDLGSGAGFDVFLAANKVGPDGRAIGVDMSKGMLELARKNMEKSKALNVSFVEASITSIPLPSAIADCITSNCVINLVPDIDKPMVFHEMFRLLKPGGRVAVSDIVAKCELPADIKRNMALYVGCIAGASNVGDYERYLKEAGFEGGSFLKPAVWPKLTQHR